MRAENLLNFGVLFTIMFGGSDSNEVVLNST